MTMDQTTPDNIRKVPASAGAQWLIDGFALLKASPGGYGVMGLMYGVFSAAMAGISFAIPQSFFIVQTLVIVIAPALTGALVWAARELKQGREVGPASYAEPMRQGRVAALLATLLPYVAFLVVMSILMRVLIGPDNIKTMVSIWQTMQDAKPGAVPDPALLATLPAGRVLAFLACSVVLAFAVVLASFVAVPGVMLGGRTGIDAVRDSWHASVRNLPAVLVFFLLVVVAAIGVGILSMIAAAIFGLLLGQIAQLLVLQLLFSGTMSAVTSGAIASAWQSMLGQEAGPPTLPAGQLQA